MIPLEVSYSINSCMKNELSDNIEAIFSNYVFNYFSGIGQVLLSLMIKLLSISPILTNCRLSKLMDSRGCKGH